MSRKRRPSPTTATQAQEAPRCPICWCGPDEPGVGELFATCSTCHDTACCAACIRKIGYLDDADRHTVDCLFCRNPFPVAVLPETISLLSRLFIVIFKLNQCSFVLSEVLSFGRQVDLTFGRWSPTCRDPYVIAQCLVASSVLWFLLYLGGRIKDYPLPSMTWQVCFMFSILPWLLADYLLAGNRCSRFDQLFWCTPFSIYLFSQLVHYVFVRFLRYLRARI
jgi:hypothetical protein